MRGQVLFVPETVPLSPPENEFYSKAYPRILKFMLGIGILSLVLILAHFGRAAALGFLVGGVISGLNFYWLKQVVSALADGITENLRRGSATGVIIRFLARYALIAVIAYAIFSSPTLNIYGFFAGLFLPVAAMFGEALFEFYAALRHGL